MSTKVRNVWIALFAFSVFLNPAAAADSAAVSVFTDSAESFHWRTLAGDTATVSWSWPLGAESATLTITGGVGCVEETFGRAVSNYTWRVPAPANAEDETAYSLSLVFRNAASEVVDSLSESNIGRVRGVNGGDTALIPGGESDAAWIAGGTLQALVPLPARAASCAFGPETNSVVSPGWARLGRFSLGTETRMALLDSENEPLFSAVYSRIPTGTILHVR